MVEVKSRYITFIGVLIVFVVTLMQPMRAAVQPRFEGLRRDSLYMALLERESKLKTQESAMLEDIDKRRAALKPSDEKSRKKLESLEFELFDIKQEHDRLLSQVRDIEQRWELRSIDVEAAVVDEGYSSSGGIEIVGEGVSSVVESRVVQDMLSKGDYMLLQNAQKQETISMELHAEYMTQYNRMRDLQQLYAQSEDEEEAGKYMEEFLQILPLSDSLLVALDGAWSVAYADKVFAFNMILEVLGREDILLRGESLLRSGSAVSTSGRESNSRIAVLYDSRRRALLDYEILIAEVLKLSRAEDAMRSRSELIKASGEVEMLVDIEIKERNFIAYEDIKFSSSQIYSKSKPIPEAKLYQKGTVYRIQMGAYKTAQSPTIFRGAYPLSYDKALGFWTYYTGAYATMLEAQKAQALCKKRGFNRPEIVAWRDGVRRNINREPLPASKGFRVVIESDMDLTEGIEAIIDRVCGDVDITRVGADRYIVGDMSHLYIAQDLVEALAFSNDELRLSVVEI